MTNDYELERLLSHDYSPAERQRRIEALSPDQRARLETLQASNSEILATYPAHQMARAIEAKRPAVRPARVAAAAMPVLALAAVLMFAVMPSMQAPNDLVTSGIRAKSGTPSLMLYKSGPTGGVPLQADALVRPGDRVQVQMVGGAEGRFGAVLSLDGRGQVTRHHPQRGRAVPLAAGDPEMLPSSFVLDDSPRYEIFFFVTAPVPFDPQLVADALVALDTEPSTADLALPDATWTQSRVVLMKDVP